MFDCPEDNTDDEQEELPFDDDLQTIYQHKWDSQHLKDFTSVKNTSQSLFAPQISSVSEEQSNCYTQCPQRMKIHLASSPKNNNIAIAMATEKELPAGDFISSGRNPHFSNSNISDVLLRHFFQEELSNACQLIDCETIPEISFTDSFDETILNKIKISESTRTSSSKEKNYLEEMERKEKSEPNVKSWDLIEGKQLVVDERVNFNCEKKDCEQDNPQFVTQEKDTMTKESGYFPKPEQEYQEQLVMPSSSHKFRYGQHQVHYQLPDFSKVAPKVKIPKGNIKSAPIIKKIKSSPTVLDKSTIVKDLLEAMDSANCVATKNQEEELKIPEFEQRLELLTKQAEAQNHIDHLRFNAKMLPSSNSCSPKLGTGMTSEISTVLPVTVPVKPMLAFSESSISELPSRRMISPLPSAGASALSPLLLQKATDGCQMLKEQTEELKTKVEMFSRCMAQGVLPLEECHQVLKVLKEHLDQLEWNYLDTKEKYHGLRIQNYRQSSTSTGEFDPDRRVEGEIFKLGMLLEDIKEKTDKMGSPNSSAFATSPSLTPCESVHSSYSSGPQSPVNSTINKLPSGTAAAANIFENDKRGENRNNPVEVTLPSKYQQPTQSCGCHPFLQDQLESQKKTVYEQRTVEPSEESRLPADKQPTHYCYLSSDKETGELPSYGQFPLNQNGNNDGENENGSLNYWETPPLGQPHSTSNQESNTTNLTLKEQGCLNYSSDCCFLNGQENYPKEHNIIIHPRLKIQLSRRPNKQIYSGSSRRNKKPESKNTHTVNAESENFSIFLEGTTLDLDVSGSDTEDASVGDLKNYSRSELFLEPETKHHELRRVNSREQSKALLQRDGKTHFHTERKRNNYFENHGYGTGFLHKKSMARQRPYVNKPPEEFIYKLSDRQNLHVPQPHYSRTYDTIILSPQYLARASTHGKSMGDLRKRHTEDMESKIFNSTLDHVMQTANNLKRTTERMMQAISEELARAKMQASPSVTANQYYI